MKAITIAVSNLRRMFRNRESFFFVFILPIALIFLIGAQFGGSPAPSLGVVSGEGQRSQALVDALGEEARLDVVSYAAEDELRTAVERGNVNAGLLIPPEYDAEITADTSIDMPFFARPDGLGPQLQAVVGSVVAEETAPLVAAIVADGQGAGPIDQAEARARELAATMPTVEVVTSTSGESLFPSTLGRFDLGAASQLTLFMFVTALTGAAVLIETRRLGISTRMISTPTPVGTVVAGEGLGRYLVVLFQGLYIMLATLVIFRVDWGDPVGAIAVVLAFAAVGAGTAMLFGTLFSNAQQAAGVGVVFGLGLAALGGSMVPAELFSDTLQQVARLTPHYWANSAFAELVRNGGTLADILPQLGVLLVYASALLLLATWRMRVVLTRT